MENKITKAKKSLEAVERIAVKSDALARLNGWLEQLSGQYPGIRVSRSELVEWLIRRHSDELSPEERSSIKDQYFDEIQLALWAVKALKAARAGGQILTLSEVIGGGAGPENMRLS